MNVQVQFWGVARRLAGEAGRRVELPEGSDVGQLMQVLAGQGGLGEVIRRCAFSVGTDLVPRSHRLNEGDEVAVLPPVNGG